MTDRIVAKDCGALTYTGSKGANIQEATKDSILGKRIRENPRPLMDINSLVVTPGEAVKDEDILEMIEGLEEAKRQKQDGNGPKSQ